MDLEKAESPGVGSSDDTTIASQADLEKAESYPNLSQPPIASTTSRQRTQSLSRSRSLATDGYSCYNLDGDEPDENEDPESAKRVSTSAFEVRWDGDNDPACPRNFNKFRKWLIVLIASSCSFCVTCTSSIYTLTYGQIMTDLNCSREIATLGLSTFVLGLAFGPMLLGPLSEFYGRRPIYVVSMGMFVIWLIPCAVAQNIQTMIIGRFFDGFAGSAFLAVAAGSVVDLFDPTEIQFPMMIYTASPFLGPAVGPIIGGFINQFTTWRWTFYVLLIWSGVLFASVVFCVPETFHKVLLKNKAQQKRKDTGVDQWYAPIEKMDRTVIQTLVRSCYVPFKLLFLEPMCMLLCLYSALLLGILYLFFGAFPLVFRVNHDFELWQVGLTFCGLGVGMIVGVMTDPWWHKNYSRLVRKQEEAAGQNIKPEPEFRLPPAMAGAILVPIGLFWFGWTTYRGVHWMVPIVGSAFFGGGVFLAFSGILTFLVDAYPTYAASAVAANCLVRLWFAAAFPLFGTQMYETLGYQWASSLLGFLSLACLPFPFLFFKYGKQLRAKSKFTNN